MLQAVERTIETVQPVVTIGSRYNGPPSMGNGGVTAGLLSRFFEGPVETTLRRPVPLELPLKVDEKPEHVALWHEYSLIASVRPVRDFDIEVPAPTTFEDAVAASRASTLYEKHVFPHCFVCGTQRADGLGIFPGPVDRRDGLFAAPWVPRADLAEDGAVAPEFVWGALDCPAGIASVYEAPRPIVLGRITGEIIQPVRPDERYVVTAWRAAVHGRKHYAGTALYDAAGRLVGSAASIWFEV